MSVDYEKITGFFEDLNLHLNQLKILEGWIPTIAAFETVIVQVLTSMLLLCGICAKYIKTKRIGTRSPFDAHSLFVLAWYFIF